MGVKNIQHCLGWGMDITKIEILLRAIELGSMSKAAEEFSYTPSALSHILNSIESEIGSRIIKRTHVGIEVYDDKVDIIDKLRQIVELKNQILNMACESANRKIITIGTYSSLSKYVLPRIIKGFKKMYPDIDIKIIVDDKLADVCDKGIADVLFGEKIEKHELIWEELMTDPYVAVAPESYNKTTENVSRKELSENTFIMAMDGRISEYMSQCKIDDVISINSHDDSSVIQLVKEGMGVAILPELSVAENKGVHCLHLEPELKRVLGLMYKRESIKENEHIKHFIEYFKSFKLQRRYI